MNAAAHLAEVAGALQTAGVDVVFIGGATIALYLDEAGAAATRATEDIDCIVDCVLAADFSEVEERLRSGGFHHCLDEDAPICRWVFRTAGGSEVLVDVMPVADLLGFENRFYAGAVASAERRELAGLTVQLPTPGFALATKVAAWQGRGRNDPFSSKDFEDIIALADGCPRLCESTRGLPAGTQNDVAMEVQRILMRPDSRALVHAMVPPPPTRERVDNCLAVLRAIAELATRSR